MKIPDPKDLKYWYYDHLDLQKRFNEKKYIEDFNECKAKLRQKIIEWDRKLSNSPPTHEYVKGVWDEMKQVYQEILGE